MSIRAVSGLALGTGAAGTDPSAIGATPKWVKVGSSIAYTALQVVGTSTTEAITLFSLLAGGVVHGIKLKHSTAFAGTAITAVTLAVGNAITADKYSTAFDVLQAVADTTFILASGIQTESHGSATNILLTVTTTGANTSALTAGVVDVWALLSVAL